MAKESVVGVVSAREIVSLWRRPSVNKDNGLLKAFDLDTRYIPLDLFLWRCEQYKKYCGVGITLFRKDYLKFFDIYAKDSSIFGLYRYQPFDVWLFDFVMTGGLDNGL